MSKVITTTTIATGYVSLIGIFVLLAVLILGIYLGAFLFVSIPLISIVYMIYRTSLCEVRVSEKHILISHIFRGTKRYSKQEFISISKSSFPLATLKISFDDGHSYPFFPFIKIGFLDLGIDAYEKYMLYWNQELTLKVSSD